MTNIKIAAVLCATVALGGCSVTTGGITTATDSTVTAFQNVCLALPQAHQDFLSIAAAFKVKQSVMDTELKWYNTGVRFCASGIVGDAATAVKNVSNALANVNAAKQQATQ